MKTAIVSDSNCSISKSEADDLRLLVLPMPVCIENAFYHEGIGLDQKRFSDTWRTTIKSSPHSPPPETCTSPLTLHFSHTRYLTTEWTAPKSSQTTNIFSVIK